MSQLWALVADDGTYMLRYTDSADHHPADAGHADECEGRAVWPLSREPSPRLGEGIDRLSGEFDFDVNRVAEQLVADIKTEAGRRIDAIAPVWRQLNDLNDPTTTGAADRASFILATRAWSNTAEDLVLATASVTELSSALLSIEQGWPTFA